MEPRLQDHEVASIKEIFEAVFFADAPRPGPGQEVAKWLWLAGLALDVSPGSHWRLYAVYTDRLDPEAAPVGNGKTLGIPGTTTMPDLVPAVATNGRAGWVEHHQLTGEGTRQAPIPVYGADGTTVIGEADVSQPYRH